MHHCDTFDMCLHWKRLQKRTFWDRDFWLQGADGEALGSEGRMKNEVAGGAAKGIGCQNVSLPDPTEFSSSPYVIGGIGRTHRIMGRNFFYPFANRWAGGA